MNADIHAYISYAFPHSEYSYIQKVILRLEYIIMSRYILHSLMGLTCAICYLISPNARVASSFHFCNFVGYFLGRSYMTVPGAGSSSLWMSGVDSPMFVQLHPYITLVTTLFHTHTRTHADITQRPPVHIQAHTCTYIYTIGDLFLQSAPLEVRFETTAFRCTINYCSWTAIGLLLGLIWNGSAPTISDNNSTCSLTWTVINSFGNRV